MKYGRRKNDGTYGAEDERKAKVSDSEATEKNEKSGGKHLSKGYLRAIPLILAASAVFLAFCFLTEDTGTFGKFISHLFKGLFSYTAYAIPFLMVIHAYFFKSDLKKNKLWSRVIFSSIALVTFSILAYIIPNLGAEALYFTPSEFYTAGTLASGGGLVGGAVGYALHKFLGMPGLLIILGLIIAIYATFFFAGKGQVLYKFILKKIAAVLNFGAELERKKELRRNNDSKPKGAEAPQKEKVLMSDKKAEDFMNDSFFYADNGMSKLEIPELGILETKENAISEAGYILRDSVDRERAYRREPEKNEPSREAASTEKEQFERSDVWKESYRSDDIVFEKTPSPNPYGLDDSADAVFARDFDPFDLATNERLATKRSSRSTAYDTPEGSYTEDISNLTPEKAEQLRRINEFELKRKEALMRRAAREEAERQAEAQHKTELENANEPLGVSDDEQNHQEINASDVNRLADENLLYAEIRRKVEEDMAREKREAEEAQRAAEQRRQNELRLEEQRKTMEAEIRRRIQAEWEAKNQNAANIQKENESYLAADSISFKDDIATHDLSFTNGYTYGGEDKEDATENFAPEFSEIAENEGEVLTVNRTMLDREFSAPAYSEGLDFSEDDEENSELDEKEDELSEEPERFEEPVEIPLAEQNPKIGEYQGMFDIFKKPASNELYEIAASDGEDSLSEEDGETKEVYDTPPFDMEEVEIPKAKPATESKKASDSSTPDYSNYKFPPYELLSKGGNEDTAQINEEAQRGAEQLINALDAFNIAATVRGIERGPRITRYSIVPAKGIRVNQIEKLKDDITMALAAESIRIEAPIPGRSAVGVEVPNSHPSIVTLRDLLEADEFVNAESRTTVCIGKSVEGKLVYGDISSMPHLLIAGATGTGKSVCMNSLIMSILYKARPDEVRFIMIDPKKVEFAPYNGIPHLLVPVVTDPKQAAGALVWAVEEMEKRYTIIEKLAVKNIDTYNAKVKANPELGTPLPKIVIFIDELNDLMVQVREPVEKQIMLITQKSRAAGIHLVIGTQRPSVNVITGVIKTNIPGRIACKVSSGVDSRTILDDIGAENLIGKGDMLFSPGDKPTKRVQGAFVSEAEAAEIIEFVKAQAKSAAYDEQAMEDIKRATQKCNKDQGDDEDEGDYSAGQASLRDKKFLTAIELAIRNGSVATSFLQRKLTIGYGKAAKYIDTMEELGIVGEKNGTKPREILISMPEWNEKLARLISIDE